jgi:hypothetical protein
LTLRPFNVISTTSPFCHAEFARRLAADEHRVVPGQLGDGIGQLLHPAVVRVTPVVHLRIAIENDFEAVL